MNRMIKVIAVSAVIMLILDFLFLYVNRRAFSEQIALVQRVVLQMNYSGALICYALLIFGLYYFILRQKRSIGEAFLFGLVIYGVYDSTNYAMLKRWSPSLALMDTLWGGTLMALTTYLTYEIVPIL